MKLSILCLTLILIPAFAQKPDFTGVWMLDPDRSFNNGAGFQQTMTVTRGDGGKLVLEAKQTTPRGEVTINEEYLLDGMSMEVKPQGAPPNAAGKRKSYWMPNDRGILIEDEVAVDGKVVRQITRKWQLSPDGKTLTVDIYMDDQRGSFEIKRIYNKK